MSRKENLRIKLGGLPLPLMLFGVLLIFGGLSLGINIISLIIILAGLFLATARDRMVFEYNQMRILKYTSFFFWFKKSESIDVSTAEYISRVRVSVSQRVNYVSLSSNTNQMMNAVYLIFPNQKKIKLFRANGEKCALLASQLASRYGLKILDSTSGKQVWVESEMVKNV